MVEQMKTYKLLVILKIEIQRDVFYLQLNCVIAPGIESKTVMSQTKTQLKG
ncbi:hypothetical protein Syun_002785 [Stephania yunnanensis]|uniref:Uncharacterized protein n=1 Tax=Stephania yunnanensis TaxID=152371 RepID=A0AAP0LH13_9MAGN